MNWLGLIFTIFIVGVLSYVIYVNIKGIILKVKQNKLAKQKEKDVQQDLNNDAE